MFSRYFISASNEYSDYERVVHAPYLRKVFQYKQGEAEITICGLGFYELFINGKRITKGKMAPYIANPDNFLYYDTYNITQYLKVGKNAIGILLGNGLLNSRCTVGDFAIAPFRSAPKVAISFTLDGVLQFEADESFLTHPSPIVMDDYRLGEYYDARLEIQGWNLSDFDDSDWQPALKAKTPMGEPRIPIAEPIQVWKELKPVAIKEYDGGYLYDFGENNAGICRLTIQGQRGQELVLTHGELLVDGKLTTSNIIFAYDEYKHWMHVDKYTLKGEGVEVYEPSFTYHGFRYVYVQGITKEQATKELLTYLVMSSALKTKGGFACSCEMLNTLQDCVRRADLSNFYYFPTDCPQREKHGWTGDANLSAEHMSLNFDTTNSFIEWMNNIRSSQEDSGKIPCIIPTSSSGKGSPHTPRSGYTWGTGPSWDAVIATLPLTVYRHSGNLQILKDSADAIERYIQYSQTQKNQDGLFSYGLGDWCPPGEEDCKYDTPVEITDTINHIDTLENATKIYEILNDSRAKWTRKLKSEILEKFRKKYIKNGRMTVATQTGLAKALYHNIVEEKDRESVFAQLLERIQAKGEHFDTGALGARVIFRVLTEFGKVDLAYKLITQDSFPSYAYPVLHGGTALMETMQILKENSLEAVNGFNISQNHHFFGDKRLDD